MKILMIYAKDQYTTGRYFENILRLHKDHKVVTAGTSWQGIRDRVNIETPQRFMLSDVLKQCPEKPDFIFVMQGYQPLDIIGLENTDIPTAFYGIDTHNATKDYVFNMGSKCKYVFYAQKKGVEEFKKEFRREAVWLPCSAEPLIHAPMNFDQEYDFAFIGGVDLKEAHKRRRDLIKRLMEKYKVFVGSAYGFFLAMKYNQAKCVFNVAFNDDINMRLFEGLSCGRAVLTDKLSPESGLNELFEDGVDIMTYTDDTIMEKAAEIISNKDLRDKIAKSGREKVINNHTYECRLNQILFTIKEPKHGK